MTPETRKRLVTKWRRFSDRYEALLEKQDDAVDVTTVGDILNDTGDAIALMSARAQYLRALVEEGILKDTDQVPDDERLWEIHPANTEPNGGDLYE